MTIIVTRTPHYLNLKQGDTVPPKLERMVSTRNGAVVRDVVVAKGGK